MSEKESGPKRHPWAVNLAYMGVAGTLASSLYYAGGRNEKLNALDAVNAPAKFEQINEKLSTMSTDVAIIKVQVDLILRGRRASEKAEAPTSETETTTAQRSPAQRLPPRRTAVLPE